MVVPLAMGWRHVLIANWPIDPRIVDAHLPQPLTSDTFDGRAWVSVVPFTNVALRPNSLPGRLGIRLPEINVRTYVTHADVPGVYFFSLDAQGILSVLGARLFHQLPYFYARISLSTDGNRVTFRSRRRHPGARPARFFGTYRPTGPAFAADEDPRAAFLAERYRFYTADHSGAIRYTDVDHDTWTLHPADAEIHVNTMLSAHGLSDCEFDPVFYYSPGLDVIAGRSQQLEQ